ncbi:MAG: TerB family tellurite resistance protein [Myxococcota bacterium]
MHALLQQLDERQLHALVQVMTLAAVSDDEVDPSERAELSRRIIMLGRGSAHEAALAPPRVDEVIDGTIAQVAGGQRAEVLAAITQRLPTPEVRRAALELAIVVTIADGIIRTSERELIMELAEGLAIDPDQAADLVIAVQRATES